MFISSSSAFQQIIRIFAGINGVVTLLNDVLVYGSTTAEHDRKAVLDKLDAYDVMFNAGKCLLDVCMIEFDDHPITDMGFSPLSSIVAAEGTSGH